MGDLTADPIEAKFQFRNAGRLDLAEPSHSDGPQRAHILKDLQAAQMRTANEARVNLQLLTSEQAPTQAATKTVSDAVTALQARVGELQLTTAPLAINLAPARPRTPPGAIRPVAQPAKSDLEPPPGAPTRIVPR
jgi:hypothetical protein